MSKVKEILKRAQNANISWPCDLNDKELLSLIYPCVSLLGSQLAPKDIIGVPQIVDGCSTFCPPKMIARSEPYCLFLDELNA